MVTQKPYRFDEKNDTDHCLPWKMTIQFISCKEISQPTFKFPSQYDNRHII